MADNRSIVLRPGLFRHRAFLFMFWAGVFTALFAPLYWPLLESSWKISYLLAESSRWVVLATRTWFFFLLTTTFALPISFFTTYCLLLEKPKWAVLWQISFLVALFLPLSVVASSWQLVLENLVPKDGHWQPWRTGFVTAAGIHAVAAYPWVVLIFFVAIRQIDRESMEEALLATSYAKVFRFVVCKRIRPALAWALLFLLVQTTTEITVTDQFLVQTFAEEVYTQFVSRPDGMEAAVIMQLPIQIAFLLIALGLVYGTSLKPQVLFSGPMPWNPPRSIWTVFARWLLRFLVLIYWLVPLGFLIWKAGGGDTNKGFAWASFQLQMQRIWLTQSGMILDSLFWSALTGVVVVFISWVLLQQAKANRWFRWGLLASVFFLWITPGPVLGFGWLRSLDGLLDLEETLLGWIVEGRPLRWLLYEEPSGLPVLLAQTLRFSPYAMMVLWPVLQSQPRTLADDFRLYSSHRFLYWRHVDWPYVRPAIGLAILGITALSLGEISVSKIVQVPGRQTYVQELFNQMHYGAGATVAAMCLGLLGLLLLLTLVGWGLYRWSSRGLRPSSNGVG